MVGRPRGWRAKRMTLDERRVRLARTLYAKGAAISKMAKAAGISHHGMWQCVTGRSYQWVA